LSASVDVPKGVELDFPLARLTTIRTGGPAEYFARAGSLAQLERLLRWANEAGLAVGVIGSGSNLLVADAGVSGLVVKLDRALAKIEHRDRHLICGGGARLPQAAARAAGAGLGGLEFGVNIPGTVGGAVKMNANAYGGELQRVLEWVDVATAHGTDRRAPGQLGFAYRRSNLGPHEIVARASFALEPADADAIKAVLTDMRSRRKAAQPSGIKTFGSTFKNPDDPKAEGRTAGQLLETAGCNGLRIGHARFSPKHANFIENVGGEAATSDVLALMTEGRRRVLERFDVVLEPEVQILGEAQLPGDVVEGDKRSEG
jgi:UDP-N-acetylenolpyruvoylglucosamine reductase